MSLLINGSLQYKTSLAWSTLSNNGVSSFTLLDKEVAICKVIHNYSLSGTSEKTLIASPYTKITTGPYVDGSVQSVPYLCSNSQTGVRILRVGSTLYHLASSTLTAKGASDGYAQISGIEDENYTWDISLSTDTVSGSVSALSHVDWNGAGHDASLVNGGDGYNYQLKGFIRTSVSVVFANLQIFKPGF